MKEIVHFDISPFMASLTVKIFESRFAQYDFINYEFMKGDGRGFNVHRESLEKILPEKDVLLIHPGIHGQSVVNEYPQKFPGLHVIYLVQELGDYYEIDGNLAAFGYVDPVEQKVIDYVLSICEEKEK